MPERGRPLDARCSSAANCASGYCSHLFSTCRQHLPEGAPCAASSSGSTDYDDCALGLYCGAQLECTPRGAAGQRCEPRFGGRDCFSSKGPFESGKCIERASGWTCDADSLALGRALCDGPRRDWLARAPRLH